MSVGLIGIFISIEALPPFFFFMNPLVLLVFKNQVGM